MIFGSEHARNDRNLGTRGNQLAHQFARETPVQERFYAHDSGPTALRGVGGYTDYADALFLGVINKWTQVFWISCGENDSVDAAPHKFLERLGISLSERLNRAIHGSNRYLCHFGNQVDSASLLGHT